MSYEARRNINQPWVWEVWNIEHNHPSNHFPVLVVNTNGAGDDLHEAIARDCARTLNLRYGNLISIWLKEIC